MQIHFRVVKGSKHGRTALRKISWQGSIFYWKDILNWPIGTRWSISRKVIYSFLKYPPKQVHDTNGVPPYLEWEISGLCGHTDRQVEVLFYIRIKLPVRSLRFVHHKKCCFGDDFDFI